MRLLLALVLVSCGPAARRAEPATPANAVTNPAATTEPVCEPPPADASTPHGDFVYTDGYRELWLYRIDDHHCAKLLATVDTGGRFAFVHIEDVPPDKMPKLTIDTWLMHGDRLRTEFVWLRGRYVEMGGAEEIPGPRKRP